MAKHIKLPTKMGADQRKMNKSLIEEREAQIKYLQILIRKKRSEIYVMQTRVRNYKQDVEVLKLKK